MKIPGRLTERVAPKGVYAAAITPRRDREVEVDLGAMLDCIDFAASRGADGIVLFSSSGEFVHYTMEERSRFIGLAAKRSRVPVLANVSHSTLDGAVALAEEAAGAGVGGVLVLPPYFYHYDAESVRAYFLELAAQVSKWTSVFIDYSPGITGPLTLEFLEDLLASGAFAGIKDSSGEWPFLEHLGKEGRTAGVQVICGDDQQFARARLSGIEAGISEIAGAVPELMAGVERAVRAGGAQVSRLQLRIEEFLIWSNRFPAPVAVREACALRGLKTGACAIPLGPAMKRALTEFREWFGPWVQQVEQECKAIAVP